MAEITQKYDDLELWSVDDIMQKFKIARSTVYHMAARGTIPAIKIGGKTRFRPSTILKWVEAQEKGNYGSAA